jgi:hypothetical protein
MEAILATNNDMLREITIKILVDADDTFAHAAIDAIKNDVLPIPEVVNIKGSSKGIKRETAAKQYDTQETADDTGD